MVTSATLLLICGIDVGSLRVEDQALTKMTETVCGSGPLQKLKWVLSEFKTRVHYRNILIYIILVTLHSLFPAQSKCPLDPGGQPSTHPGSRYPGPHPAVSSFRSRNGAGAAIARIQNKARAPRKICIMAKSKKSNVWEKRRYLRVNLQID